MIVYQSTKSTFLNDVDDRDIADLIQTEYVQRTGRYASDSEYRAWRESLMHMARVLRDKGIPEELGVGVEFVIPQTPKRIDFLLTGTNAYGDPRMIIVELKQWSSAKLSPKDGIVIARRGGAAESEGTHPSYQAWSYAALLEGFNEAVYEGNVDLKPCAYLHNYKDDAVIRDARYAPYLERAPVFLDGADERQKLREFIKANVPKGDSGQLLYKVENGRIRPSKFLADSIAKMLKGNEEFVLIDDQKLVFESALAITRAPSGQQKHVVIIHGGPGTGKSVVAIHLLAALTKLGLLTKYVSKNAAPRKVYASKLAGDFRRVQIDALFAGSGSFIDTPSATFDALIVDEAHRLNAFSGLYANLGENQIKELIKSARCCVFFVDDNQVVTLQDIGESQALKKWAVDAGAEIHEYKLNAQFRCGGAQDYLSWLDSLLGLAPALDSVGTQGFDFRVVESPGELHDMIRNRNGSNRARVVAGYCWDWNSRRNAEAFDVDIPEAGYTRRWNLDQDGSLWIVAPHSIEEVGCIHTCQGLEVDYVGVIIGPDLIVRDGKLLTDVSKRSRQDRTVRGWRNMVRRDPAAAYRLDRIIRNTYRTLLTRGMKGCYVYCTDPETQSYFRERLAKDSVAK